MSFTSSFSDLCPDILLDIFTYFSLNELFDIFISLIPYLPTLLNESHVKFHIDKKATEDFWNRILPQINSNQIISLDNRHSIINLLQFSSTRSLSLNLQSSCLFNQFQYLIHLEQLSLRLSEEIIQENIWLSYILQLSNLKILKLDLMIEKNVFKPQKNISISQVSLQSWTIKYLEIKIPMTWEARISFLNHFPNLQIFRALLYQLHSNMNDSFISIPNVSCLNSLERLDLFGYFDTMSTVITSFCASISNLKQCRLVAVNVTNDSTSYMQDCHFWKYLFDCCADLSQLKIYLLMSTEENNTFNLRGVKDRIRAFNNNPFFEKHNIEMELPSMNRGYVTLISKFHKKKK